MPDFRQRFAVLVASDRQPIRAEAPTPRGDDTTAVLRLYDPIDSYGGDWGVSAKEFADVLDELPDTVTNIRLLINSPGGEATEGIAILNVLRAHPASTTAVVEGIAASAASFIACGCDELIMARNSDLFIHDAWGLCVGNADDMRKLADDLDHVSDNIASIYAAKAGGTVADWRAQMAAETWLSAEQAVEAGLADSVDTNTDDEAAATAKNRFDLTIFKNSGTPGIQVSATPPSPSPTLGQLGGSMSDLTELRAALGLPEETDDGEVIAAAITKATAPPPEPPEPQLPEGVVAIDNSQLEQLRADATAGREARAQQLTDERARIVDAAVRDGRIPPARRDHWLAQLEADPGAEQTLATLAPGLVPVAALGTGGSVDLNADDAFYNNLFPDEKAAV